VSTAYITSLRGLTATLERLRIDCQLAEAIATGLTHLAPGLVSGLYLVGSVALGDFHPCGAGRGRLSTASDTVACFPRPHFDGAVLTWTDLEFARTAGIRPMAGYHAARVARSPPDGRSGSVAMARSRSASRAL
jgi:hypothetical protein